MQESTGRQSRTVHTIPKDTGIRVFTSEFGTCTIEATDSIGDLAVIEFQGWADARDTADKIVNIHNGIRG